MATTATEYFRARHVKAMNDPAGHEVPIVRTLEALDTYAQLHLAKYGSSIGQDGVLCHGWLKIASGLQDLLNGETGRLDCGTVDAALRQLARDNGFSEQEVDEL